MDTAAYKWLNFLLTFIAAIAIYYFLHDSIPEQFRIPLMIGLVLIVVVSLIVAFRRETPRRDEDQK
jgi:undecaprenyl pyrophosphate phosphatase UppP